MATFDDHKDSSALRTIGEVARATGIKAHILRYWEQQFPQLKPLKRSGGRRYFRPEDIELVERIDRLVNREGYTLKGAKAALANTQDAPATPQDIDSSGGNAGREDPADIVSQLKAIRDDLRGALTA